MHHDLHPDLQHLRASQTQEASYSTHSIFFGLVDSRPHEGSHDETAPAFSPKLAARRANIWVAGIIAGAIASCVALSAMGIL
jgi:hypothetical protein